MIAHRRFHYRLLVISILNVCGLSLLGHAQTNPQIAPIQAKIGENLAAIHVAEQQHLPAAQQGAMWAKVALEYQTIAMFQKAEDAYNRSLHLLKADPAEYASTLDNLAVLYLSYDRVEDAESTEKQALMERKKSGK